MVERAAAGIPRARRAAELATIVRVERGPGISCTSISQKQGGVAGEWANYQV